MKGLMKERGEHTQPILLFRILRSELYIGIRVEARASETTGLEIGFIYHALLQQSFPGQFHVNPLDRIIPSARGS
jgi:hypothetical protein